jgi:hypothetical protein
MTVKQAVVALLMTAASVGAAATARANEQALGPPAESAATGTTPLRVTGTLQGYDAQARQVAVATAAGNLRLLMTGDTRVRQGGRAVDAGQLRSRIGAKVVVRYVEAERGRVVVSLTVVDHGAGSSALRRN